MKPKVNDVLTYIPLNQRATVVHVTPYHDANDPAAVVTIRLRSGDLRNIPVALLEKNLTTEAPKSIFKRLTPASSTIKG